MSDRKTVALLLGADITDGRKLRGGVAVVASFLYQQLLNSGRYAPYYISMAASSRDDKSVRLLSPSSWKSEPQLVKGEWNNVPYTHAGALFTEFEFQRYKPRSGLTEVLNQFDLVQVVSGSPAIAHVTKYVDVPVCLFVATMISSERRAMLRKAGWVKKIYGYLMLPIVSGYDKQALKHIKHVFAETLYVKQALTPFILEEKITVDSIGIDVQRFRPVQYRSDDYILCTGRLSDPRKNVRLLFEAYTILRRQIPDAPRLVLAGISGPTKSDWAFARQLGVYDHIEFRHEVPIAELIQLYQNAVFFALSSDEEGLGIVLLEAMACATPVVSTRSGGPDSVVSEQVGFLTPVGDAQEMANHMLLMLRNPEKRRQMGQAGRQMVESRFSNEVVGQKYLTVYDKLLGVKTL